MMWSTTHVDGIVKDSDTLINQNFGLSKDQFDVMVINLKNGNEQLFEKIFLSHFQSCMQYLAINYKIDNESAYDITMDAMIEFRHKLILDKLSYGNLRYIFTKIASQLLIKENNRETKIKQIFFDHDNDNTDIEFKFDVLDKAWVSLSEEEKMILEAYYYNELPLNQLALQMNKTDIAIRKQKQRAIEKLKQNFFNIFKY